VWVRILRERLLLLPPKHRAAIRYEVGQVVPIRRIWGEQLIADGSAVEVPAQRRQERTPWTKPGLETRSLSSVEGQPASGPNVEGHHSVS
jgi:hypothetical protein